MRSPGPGLSELLVEGTQSPLTSAFMQSGLQPYVGFHGPSRIAPFLNLELGNSLPTFPFPFPTSLHSIPPQAAFLNLPLSSPRLVSYLLWIRKPLPPLSPLSLGSFLLSGLRPILDEISILMSPEAHKRMCRFQLFRKLLLDKMDRVL